MSGDYRATQEEIGKLRVEVRKARQQSEKTGLVPYFLPMKLASLDAHSRMWLVQYMRPVDVMWIASQVPDWTVL